ncbi:hypothetical protein MMC20_006080 [Loxospora ochrophaea]|nr:hypothetical protein [Loxospora ochrophaea]
MVCLHAISSLLEKDRKKRIGAAGFETFTDNPFFRSIDFEALEDKRILPIFVPSSEKTNFDATYDLEELLLEEAPLEARARRQKPRNQLKDDATDKEIREDELHRMIETLFEPFDYTTVSYDSTLMKAIEKAEKISASADPKPDMTPTVHSKSSAEEQHSTIRSDAATPVGSPPIASRPSKSETAEYFPTLERPKSNPSPLSMAPKPRYVQRSDGPPPPSKYRGGRHISKGGGVSVVLDETGSWSDLANKSATIPAEGVNGAGSLKAGKPSGMLGFLGRKRGRDRSPKPMEPGVLGKEGARVVVSGGR